MKEKIISWQETLAVTTPVSPKDGSITPVDVDMKEDNSDADKSLANCNMETADDESE